MPTETHTLWQDFPAGPHGTPSADLPRRQRTCPVAPVTLPSGDQVPMAVRYDDVRTILASASSSRQLFAPGLPKLLTGISVDLVPGVLINMDDPEHARQRRIIAGAFTVAQAERWRPTVASIAHALIDALPAGGPVDLVADYALPLASQVICKVIGMPDTDYGRFSAWSSAFLGASDSSAEVRQQAFTQLAQYMGELVAQRRASPGGDLVDMLIQARDEKDRLTDDELINVLLMLSVAGHETPAMMLSRGIYTLLRHPAQWEKLVADPARLQAAVEEILRYDGPGTNGLLRLITEDLALPSGQVVPAGSVVLPNGHAANHDPDAYPEPSQFDISRFANGETRPHLAFSHGPHYCLGAALARMQIQEGVRALVERMPGMTPAEELAGLPWTVQDLAHRPARLPVRMRR